VKIDLNGKYTRDNGKIKKVRFKLKGKTKPQVQDDDYEFTLSL